MPGLPHSIHELLIDEEDARACRNIPDSACREVPGNFLRLLASYLCTKLGDAIANPKTVLAWLCTSLGAPGWTLGLLVPLRESGSMLPQLFIGGLVRGRPKRKPVFVLGALCQAASVIGMGLVALTLRGWAAGLALLGLVLSFSLARGLCSVASKDVLGKVIPKGQRGQVTGWSASSAGLITIGLGAVLLWPDLAELDAAVLGIALFAAGGLWIVAALIYGRIVEQAGATEGGANAVRQALSNLTLLWRDRPFGRFVLTRALLMCSALSAPFYIALAQEQLGQPAWLLGLFVIAGGLAGLLSAPLWGRLADRSSRLVLTGAACLTAGIGLALALTAWWAADLLSFGWVVPTAYFILTIAHNGVRVGRKTYVVDLAEGDRRTDYVTVSNTVIGLLLLLVGSVGLLVPLIGNAGVIATLAGMGLLGALLSLSLEPV